MMAERNIFPQGLRMSSAKLNTFFWVHGIGVPQRSCEGNVLTTHLRKDSRGVQLTPLMII